MAPPIQASEISWQEQQGPATFAVGPDALLLLISVSGHSEATVKGGDAYWIPESCFAVVGNTSSVAVRSLGSGSSNMLAMTLAAADVLRCVERSVPGAGPDDWARFLGGRPYCFVGHLSEPNVGDLLFQKVLLKRLTKTRADADLSREQLLHGLAQLLIYLFHTTQTLSYHDVAQKREILERVQRAKAYILMHLDSPLSIDRMASAAFLSRAHFSRSFKHVYQLSPALFHARSRIDKAADYLRRTDLEISSIATRLGFRELSVFSRAFKSAFGVAPSLYRQFNRLDYTLDIC